MAEGLEDTMSLITDNHAPETLVEERPLSDADHIGDSTTTLQEPTLEPRANDLYGSNSSSAGSVGVTWYFVLFVTATLLTMF